MAGVKTFIISQLLFLPQSLTALKKVKGMGKRKPEKFGEELPDTIV